MFSRNHRKLLTLRKLKLFTIHVEKVRVHGTVLIPKTCQEKFGRLSMESWKGITGPRSFGEIQYDKKEGLLTTKSRTEAIGKYHYRISYYSLVPRTCELFGFFRSVARINAGRCCSNTSIYLCLHLMNLGKLKVDF